MSSRTFEHLPHLEDEVAYLWEAKLLATGHMVMDVPQPRRAFWQPFVVDYQDTRFGKYSLGWPLILTPGVIMGQPWVVNAFLAALTVGLVYRLGSEIFDPDVGLIAAGLTAFSPMALLLDGTLMGHAAALFTTMLFLYAYWRLSHAKVRRRRLIWGTVAGIALGLCVINRPLEGLALAIPFVLWSGIRLLKVALDGDSGERIRFAVQEIHFVEFRRILIPLLALAVICTVIVTIIPIYNYAATGNPRQNLYTLVWSYDQVGFGPGYGRNTHTLEKGLRQTRWDLSLTAADMFGWQTEPLLDANNQVKPELEHHLLFDGDYWQPVGLSWILLPFGLFIGWRRRWLPLAAWLVVGAGIFMYTTNLPSNILQDPVFSIRWLIGAFVWLAIPFVFFLFWKHDTQTEWTWLFLAFGLSLIGLHIAYWIGSQRYSTRYYFEILGPLSILSALPIAWLARRWRRWPVYGVLAVMLVVTLFSYSLPRINVLYRFNWVSPELIQAVEAKRTDDRPVLVLLTGSDIKWRALGSLMAITTPMLDSDIVAAIDTTQPGQREAILEQFPDRQVIEMTASGNLACFGDTLSGECYGELPADSG